MRGPAAEQIEAFAPPQVLDVAPPAAVPDVAPIVADPVDGHCAVTFVWRGEARQVLVLLNTLAEGMREDLGPALMERVPGTDLWHRTFRLPSDLRATYQLYPSGVPIETADWTTIRRGAVPDPLNPETLPSWFPGVVTSVLELPDAPPQPWRHPCDGVAPGEVTEHRVPSAALGEDRVVHVYTPAAGAGPADLLTLLDGDLWTGAVPIAPTFDGLVAGGLPPMVAVMPVSGDYAARNAELGGSEAFLTFLTEELPAWAAARWEITGDPARSTVAGQSLGGLAAAAAALRAPGRFGNVVAQSGAFWLDDESLTGRYAAAERLPVRFRLEVGSNEWRLRPAVRRFHTVLRDRGYDVELTEYAGGHDLACWRGGLADALVSLTGPRPPR